MDIRKIEIFNFCSHEYTVLNFDELPRIIPVVGKNGSGKSTLFVESIRFCLFGITRNTDRAGKGYEKDINNFSKPCAVKLTFKLDDDLYEIKRTKFYSATNPYHTLEVVINGLKHDGYLNEKQEIINNAIKFNYNSFMDVVVLQQNQSNEFIIKEASSDLFDEILFINKIKKIKKYFSEHKNAIQKEVESLK